MMVSYDVEFYEAGKKWLDGVKNEDARNWCGWSGQSSTLSERTDAEYHCIYLFPILGFIVWLWHPSYKHNEIPQASEESFGVESQKVSKEDFGGKKKARLAP